MATSTKDSITSAQATHFFLGPETVRHRQYEALRAYFVGDLSTSDVAQRFGYSPVPSASSATASATTLTSGTRSSKHRSTVPVLLPHAIAFGNSSSPCANATYLSTTSNANWPTPVMTSVSTPSRSSSARKASHACHAAATTNDHPRSSPNRPRSLMSLALNLEPRSFRTRLGGLFLFVPLMRDIRLATVLGRARLPGSDMIPAAQAVRTLLALKLVGKERHSHVMDLVTDEGIALFAGLNVVPKRSYLATYSARIDDRTTQRLMAAWFTEIQHAGLTHGTSLDLDFHSVPANSQEEPLEKHYVSRRSRSQKGILTFLARDANLRVLCYAHAGITKADQPEEVIRFVDFLAPAYRLPASRAGFRLTADHLQATGPPQPASH